MLNILSGRLVADNLEMRGILSVNGEKTKTMSEHEDKIAYVMQEDLMLTTFSPKETFRFIADMRLPHKTEEEKKNLVDNMISALGLSKCKDTIIGNSQFRGISGG